MSTDENIHRINQYCGTFASMAPEIIEQKYYDGTEVDVFTLGVVAWVLVTGKFPFNEAKEKDYYYS